MMFFKRIKILFILISLGIGLYFPASGQEQRLKPVRYKSCDSKENLDYSAKKLWDDLADIKHEWRCFHAGYQTQQYHWVIMDLGSPFAISRIVIHHEGNTLESKHLLTEDFKVLGSMHSMDGPWFLVTEIKDNAEQINTIQVPDIKMRYIGLEVSDPQCGEGPNKKQDDWAVRIFELYIYTREQPPAYVNLLSSVTPTPTPESTQNSNPPSSGNNPIVQNTPNVSSPISNPELFKTGKKLYYFFNPNVVKCQNMEKMFNSLAIKEALLPYKMEAVLIKKDDPLLTQFSVFMVPTLIITDENNKVLKRTANIMTEEDLINFLK
jgi:hypothetical protein